MEEGDEKDKGLTPERAVKLLEQYHEVITIQQARRMLEMMKLFAGVAVDQYLRSRGNEVELQNHVFIPSDFTINDNVSS